MENIFFQINKADIYINDYKEDDKLCGYELNTYTRRGVNQILFLDFRDTQLDPENPEDFFKVLSHRIDDIDIDEEIEIHRQMSDYRKIFSIRESLEDFKEWKKNLQRLAKEVQNLNLKL
ncbi:hypothetical protein [Chryseobacterium sp. ISL-6]|uniref:hypothetical protein n=1 Tax=Chryseobacterium sp. ISL-6 TaxID=2819143 RepID=UPI001BE5EAAD|nr:hypothetical protein [Chryseobacterium sp. ISL-6]MBT2621247.1 hypothetical protein [Chryseobacterium sp. ISL-6]